MSCLQRSSFYLWLGVAVDFVTVLAEALAFFGSFFGDEKKNSAKNKPPFQFVAN